MGDVLTLIEKAEEAFDEKQAKELEKKLLESSFTLDDFLDQFRQMKKMGGVEKILSMLPGVKLGSLSESGIDEKAMAKTEAIVLSMTRAERNDPSILNGSRRRRIAKGSGTSVEDVNRLIKQFDQVKKMMKQFAGASGQRRMRKMFGGNMSF